jgi:hypothetical protein
MNRPSRGLACLLAIVGLLGIGATRAAASDGSEEAGGSARAEVEGEAHGTETPERRRRILLFPVDDLYVESLAGPHRRGFAVTRVDLRSTDIVDAGDRLFGLLVGGRFGLLRVHPAGSVERGWQLGIEAGFYGQFDIDNGYDNLGWDGFYGLAWTATLAPGWAAKVGLLHTSSHVGDEYAERTGRRRIGYTREELVLGLSRSFGERWRAQAEAGWAYDLRNEELQKAERLRVAVEYLAPGTLWKGRFGWYAAVDASAFAERDWRLDWAADAGLLLSSWPRRWRLGLQYYDGRAPLGEFFQSDQRFVSLGLWLDL